MQSCGLDVQRSAWISQPVTWCGRQPLEPVGQEVDQLPLRVEGVEVVRGPLDEGLQLTLAQALSGPPSDRLPDVVEGASRPHQDGQPAQAVGVELDWQVQHGVGGMQVGVTTPPIGQAGDFDLAEHGQQPASMPGFDAAPGHSISAHDRFQARFPLRPHVQVVLEHLAKQLATLHVQAFLQLAVREPARLWPFQPAHDPLESVARGGEGRQGLVLNAVGSGGEYRVQSGASVVGVDNLPTGASLLQLHVARAAASAGHGTIPRFFGGTD